MLDKDLYFMGLINGVFTSQKKANFSHAGENLLEFVDVFGRSPMARATSNHSMGCLLG